MAKPSKAHGGRRSNAGRKPLLSLGERLEVGSICEKKWDDLAREAAESRLDKRAEADGIREEQGRLQKIQEQWGRSAAGRKSYAAEVLSVAEILEEVSGEIDAASAAVQRPGFAGGVGVDHGRHRQADFQAHGQDLLGRIPIAAPGPEIRAILIPVRSSTA
jgi:hypothetical protein